MAVKKRAKQTITTRKNAKQQEIVLSLDCFEMLFSDGKGVKKVSLEVKKGEVFGFLGPNGAGKSTTIRAIMDFIRPTSGSIKVLGLDSRADSVDIKGRLSYLAGDIALYQTLTGEQNMKYIAGIRPNFDIEIAKKLVKRFDAQLDKKIKDLSKGNRQKIGLIIALATRADLMIMDEPTSGLDPLMKEVFYKEVERLRDMGLTFFVSSHDLSEVQKMCDRAAFIKDGEIVAIKDVHEAARIGIKNYEISFDNKVAIGEFKKIKGVSNVSFDDNRLKATVEGNVSAFLKEAVKFSPVSLREDALELEEVFLHYYE